MRNVPILDEAYMARRAQQEYIATMLSQLSESSWRESRMPQEVATDAYLAGTITLQEFERRLDLIFGLKP